MSCTGHKQCPACAKLGKDNSKNNLACYADGGEYCFSCGYLKRAINRPSFKVIGNNIDHYFVDNAERKVIGISNQFTDKAAAYLYQFNLTDEEILRYQIKFIESGKYESGNVVFPIYEHIFFPTEPNQVNEFVTKKIPPAEKGTSKALSSKNAKLYFTSDFIDIDTPETNGIHNLFIVEDILSAIATARLRNSASIALLGNRLTKPKLLKLGEYINSVKGIYYPARRLRDRIYNVHIWLDNDKGGNEFVQEIQSFLSLLLPDATLKVLNTPLDPKYYSRDAIHRIIFS